VTVTLEMTEKIDQTVLHINRFDRIVYVCQSTFPQPRAIRSGRFFLFGAKLNKKDAYYFSHDCNAQDDPKCMMLIDDLGMEGYGIFWALIEKLRAEKDYTLPVSICGRFARRWATSEAKIQAVVTSYGLFEMHENMFFSLRLKRSMEEKSQKARVSAEVRWGKNQQLTEEKVCDRIAIEYERNAIGVLGDAIKGKESKVKEIEINILPENSGVIELSEKEKRFEFFWDYYGRKGNKKSAKSLFMKMTEQKISEMKLKLPAYIASTADDIQYRKDAHVYLNPSKEHWNDEIIKRTKNDEHKKATVTKTGTGAFAIC